MASAISNRVANITFNVKGFSQITQYNKYLADSKKKEYDAQKAILDTMSTTQKGYSAQARLVNRLQTEWQKLSKEALRFQTDINAVRNTIQDLSNASPKEINRLNASLSRMTKNFSNITDKDLKAKFESLVGDLRPVTEAMSEMFRKGFTSMMSFNPRTASWQQLNNYIKEFTASGHELSQVADNETAAFTKMGQIFTETQIQIGRMTGTMSDLRKNASVETIQRYIQGWQQIATSTNATATQIREANRRIADARRQLANKDTRTITNASNFSPQEVSEATDRLKKYISTTQLSKTEQQKFTAAVIQGAEALKQMTRSARLDHMTRQFQNIRRVSNDALTTQKQYWTEMLNSAKEGSAAQSTYAQRLKAVTDLERQRTNAQTAKEGRTALNMYSTGMIENSTSALQRNLDALTKWRSLIDQSRQPALFETVDAAIRHTESDLTALQQSTQMARKYLEGGTLTRDGLFTPATFKGTISDLQRIRQGLLDLRSSAQGLDPKRIHEIDSALLHVDTTLRTAGIDSARLNEIIKNPKGTYSLRELQAAYEKLKLEIARVGIQQQEYNQKSAQMKSLKTRIDSLSQSFSTQRNILTDMGTQVKNIVLHYVGLNMLVMRLINTFKGVFDLSDQMANVQKVTQMTTGEVTRLVDSLQALDSRTSTEELMKFAEQAGKLGIYTTQGVEGMKQFAEMGERITRTLGEDAGGAEAVANLVKLNNILGTSNEVIRRTGNATSGLRDSLNATGSAILNVGNNSAAGYASIVNYVGRLGAMGATSHMTVQQLIALAGTLDALKMPAESGATALNQFIAALTRRTDEMAEAAKVSTIQLRHLVSHDMMGAIQLLITQMQNGQVSAQGLMDAMSGRSRTNVNIRNVLSLLSTHMDLLNDQLKYANEGFDSAFSSRTAGNIQLVKSALDEIGWSSNFSSLSNLFTIFRNGGMEEVLNSLDSQGTLSRYTGDMDMLRTSLESVFTQMQRLQSQGRLNEQSFNSLSIATSQTSIMEQEFARVNENAAGEAARLGNMIRENFVNSGMVEFFQGVTSSLMRFILWLQSGTFFARAFGTAIVTVTAYTLAYKSRLQELITVKLWGTLTTWGTAIRAFIIAISASIRSVGLFTVAVNGCKAALSGLWNFLKTNWVTVILTALAAITYAVKSANDEAKRFARMTQEVNKGLDDEIRTATSLFAQLRNLNSANGERDRVMNQIINKYGSLIGYMNKEDLMGQRLYNTYSLVIAKLKEKAKLQLQDQLLEKAQTEASGDIADAGVKLSRATENITRDTARQAQIQVKASSLINQAIVATPNKDADQIANEVYRRLFNSMNKSERHSELFSNTGLLRSLIDLTKGIRSQVKATERVSAFIAGQGIADAAMGNSARNTSNRSTAYILNRALKEADNNLTHLTDKKLDELIQRLRSIANDPAYRTAAGSNKNLNRNLDMFTGWLHRLTSEQNRRTAITPWGNPRATGPMENWDTSVLEAYAQKLQNATNSTHPNADWTRIFPDIEGLEPGMTVEQVRDILDKEHEKVTQILKDRHLTTTGTYNHPSEHTKDTTTQEMDDARKHLEEYYRRREEMAQQALNTGETTESEYNRFIFANNQSLLANQEILEQKFLDKGKRFTTDSLNEWMQTIEGVGGKRIAIDYTKIENYLSGKGRHLTGKIRDNAAKYASDLQKNIRENNAKIEQILLDERPIAKVAQDFTKDLNDLHLLFTELTGTELMSVEEAQEQTASRLSFLMDEAKKGYDLTTAQFIKDMQTTHYGEFAPWAEALIGSPDQLSALLLKVQGFMEQYEDAVRKMITKVGKRVDQEWAAINPDTGKSLNQEFDDQTKTLDNSKTQQSLADSWGFTGHNLAGIGDTEKLQIQQLQQAVDLEKQRLQIIKERYDEELTAIREKAALEQDPVRKAQLEAEAQATEQAAMKATQEQLAKLSDARRSEADSHLSLMSKTVDQIMPFYSNLSDFATSFGQNIFGSKADRQQAAKDLLIATISTTGKMLTQWLVYIATRRIYDKMEEMQNLQHQQTMLAQTLAAKSAELQALGQYELADAALKESMGAVDAAAAAGKEAAKAGWIGFAIGAALSLAMTLAMSLATAKLKSTVSSTTGASAGKLTTGMLTYAQGRYPTYADGTMQVQGNDGRNYNAVVKPNLTTGSYTRPHLGIVGEKGAELIVDHPTFTRLKAQAPWILSDIYAIHRFGTLALNHQSISRTASHALPTHAQGLYPSAQGTVLATTTSSTGAVYGATSSAPPATSATEGTTHLNATLDRLNTVLDRLESQGVQGHFQVYGNDGLVHTYDHAKRFLTSLGK